VRFIIITGLSGSGKSTAAKVLEDEGFYVIDNLPLTLLPAFFEQGGGEIVDSVGVAVVMDVRNPHFVTGSDNVFAAIRKAGHEPEIFFFDAADDELIRRFSTTRRRHPLSNYTTVTAAIAEERSLLQPLRERATVVFDSSLLSVHQLKAAVLRCLHGSSDLAVPMSVRLQSFGFRYGIPLESDLVIDVRFLPNPHYVEALRPLTGCDKPVRDFVLEQPECCEFLDRTRSWLAFLIPRYRQEGKRYLTISIGCTGGHHRSVAIVEALRDCLKESQDVTITHRDLIKEEG